MNVRPARFLVLALLLAGLPGHAAAREWTVGRVGADFPLIGPAIAASSAGDVIRVRAGVYREDLVLTHQLTIVGEPQSIVFGTGSGTVITIESPGCEIRGLTIEGTGSGEDNRMDAAILITTDGNSIVGNRISRAFYGIVIAGGSRNRIENNEIAGFAALPFGQRGDGIYVYRATGNRIMRSCG